MHTLRGDCFSKHFSSVSNTNDNRTMVLGKVHAFVFYKQLLYKQGSTRQGKKLSNFSTGLTTAKQFEKYVNGALGRSPTNFGKSYYLD